MPRYGKRAHWPYDRVDEGLTKTAGHCPERREDLVEAESERQLADPPATWQEHWFDHRQLLRLYHSDEHCAIYVDPGVRRAEVRWLPRFINVTWQYSKATYGDAFGFDPRIYSIHHAGRHGGGHAGYYVSPVHDYHNVSDCGLDTWREGNALARELPAHEIGHSVESASNGVHGSPAYEIWGDSKWAEFYIYDLYTALGMDREAKGVYRRFTGNADDFPRRGTRWFRDWFYPLWRDCGRAEILGRATGPWPIERVSRVPGFVRAADGLSLGAARAELDPGHDGDEGKGDDPGHGDRSPFRLSWSRLPRPCLKAAADGGRRRSGSAPVHTLMRP